jgi:hypothetical protein
LLVITMASEETYKLGHARIRCDTHSQAHTRHADWHRSTCPISLPPVDTDQCPPSLDVHTSVCRTLHPNWKEQTCQVRHRFAHVTARTHTLAQAHTETARRARANAQTQCGTHTHAGETKRGPGGALLSGGLDPSLFQVRASDASEEAEYEMQRGRAHPCLYAPRHTLCRVDIRNTRHTRRNHYAQAERPGTIHCYACSTYRAYQ